MTHLTEARRGALRPRRTRAFPTLRAIVALMLREMTVSYGRSPGGYLWAVLEPAAGVFLLTAIFSLAFHAPPLGTSFAIFYATGLVPFLLYAELSAKVSQSLNFSRQLLTYPSVTYTDALLGRFLLNALTQLLVSYFLFAVLLAVVDGRVLLAPDRLALGYAMALALALGVGAMNCVLVSLLPVWQQVWSILNRPLFVVSCIFFVFESVPEPYRDILWFNPLVHVVGAVRHAFYPAYDASYVSAAYVFGLSLGLLAAGLVFLNRYNRDILHG